MGGFDEDFTIALNDVDLCLKIRKHGYLIVYTPYAKLYHHESASRCYEDTADKKGRFSKESQYYRGNAGVPKSIAGIPITIQT